MVREIDVETLRRWLADEELDPLVVDVRTAAEFELGHVPGSVNVPMAELTDRIDEIAGADPIVLVCEVGALSRQAASLVRAYEDVDRDSRVANLQGGYRAWTSE